MILKFIINVIINISFALFSLISSLLPSSNMDIGTLITSLISLTSQATNFMHFLFGDWLFAIMLFLPALLLYKFVVFPIISFMRGFIRLGT